VQDGDLLPVLAVLRQLADELHVVFDDDQRMVAFER